MALEANEQGSFAEFAFKRLLATTILSTTAGLVGHDRAQWRQHNNKPCLGHRQAEHATWGQSSIGWLLPSAISNFEYSTFWHQNYLTREPFKTKPGSEIVGFWFRSGLCLAILPNTSFWTKPRKPMLPLLPVRVWKRCRLKCPFWKITKSDQQRMDTSLPGSRVRNVPNHTRPLLG